MSKLKTAISIIQIILNLAVIVLILLKWNIEKDN